MKAEISFLFRRNLVIPHEVYTDEEIKSSMCIVIPASLHLHFRAGIRPQSLRFGNRQSCNITHLMQRLMHITQCGIWLENV